MGFNRKTRVYAFLRTEKLGDNRQGRTAMQYGLLFRDKRYDAEADRYKASFPYSRSDILF